MKMRKYLLTFSYDGSLFYGFQRQNNVRNVQGELEAALSNILETDVVIKGSGRTDAGVHALCQCAHFEVTSIPDDLCSLINSKLNDIKILSVEEVSDDFHARYGVMSKTYEYKLSFDRSKDKNYYLVYYKDLDFDKMVEASKLFVGTHDFRNFVSGTRDDYISTIFDVTLVKEENDIIFRFTGKGFYKYMVRNLVGALIDVGKGKVTYDYIKDCLENYEERRQLSTAHANGLYLVDIKY